MLPEIDYLTVHTPLTPETTNLIDTAALEIMKPGVRLINAARGAIVDQKALYEALRDGEIASQHPRLGSGDEHN